jgi:penicillin-binding protein 1A
VAVRTRSRARGGKKRPPSPNSSWTAGKNRRGFFRRYWWVFLAVPMAIAVALVGVFIYLYSSTPIPTAAPLAHTTYVYDHHGKLLTTLHAAVNRTEIPIAQMPLQMRQAVISVEDKNFYHEGGVSFGGIARAAWANLRHREVTQGGSTITQQYVKLVYTGDQRTISRKVTEAIIAMKIDKKYTKNQILEAYLNTVYFGQGAYGVQAAAETYWGIPARELNVLQSATLAGLIHAPSEDDPVLHPDAALVRRNLVLKDMAEQGYITQADAADLSARPVHALKPQPIVEQSAAPYFTDYVSSLLLSQYGEQETFNGGLKVSTSLDLGMQRDAESAVYKYLSSFPPRSRR